MAGEYPVGVSLNILNTAAGLGVLAAFHSRFSGIEQQVNKTNKALEKMRISTVAVGTAAAAVGVMGIAGLVKMADYAAKVQDSLSKAAISFRVSLKDMQAMFDQARTVGRRADIAP